MLPMEPVAAAALTRALSRQFGATPFHHARAARHLAKRQHGLHALQLALEATWRLSLHGFQID